MKVKKLVVIWEEAEIEEASKDMTQEELEALFEDNGMDNLSEYLVPPVFVVE